MSIDKEEREYINKILDKCANAPSIYDGMNTVDKIKEGLKNRQATPTWFTHGDVRVRREITPWNNN